MLVRCGLLLIALNCAGTSSTKYVLDYGYENSASHFGQRYSFWPSFHNAAKLMRLHKRAAQASDDILAKPPVQSQDKSVENTGDQPRISEGGPLVSPDSTNSTKADAADAGAVIPPANATTTNTTIISDSSDIKGETGDVKDSTAKGSLPAPVQSPPSSNTSATITTGNITETKLNNTNKTLNEVAPSVHNITSGVVKRAVIVFSGFLLLTVAYLIFYRRKGDKNSGNTNAMGDSNQFRYGVLESEDRSGNMEQSRIPLTMESDDDEDEDLEIFDLGQKKSQSYVNLPGKDEDVVFKSTENRNDSDQLLLEIEDGPSDTLINWSSNGKHPDPDNGNERSELEHPNPDNGSERSELDISEYPDSV